jgi:hypothetical protein
LVKMDPALWIFDCFRGLASRSHLFRNVCGVIYETFERNYKRIRCYNLPSSFLGFGFKILYSKLSRRRSTAASIWFWASRLPRLIPAIRFPWINLIPPSFLPFLWS